jgi:hypothetical protein
MRILITGSRDWSDYATFMRGVTVGIDTVIAQKPDDKHITIVHGGAKGADTMSETYVSHVSSYLAQKGYQINTEVHKADWATQQKAAGPIRNQKMVDLGADVTVAFMHEGSRGTADCVARCQKAGIPVLLYKG